MSKRNFSRSDREKAIDKVKKCLRLAESSEPWEAAAAMRQAQKLMQTLNITEMDLDSSEVIGEVVKTKEAFGGCTYLARLSRLIATAFACEAIWEAGNGISRTRANIRYIGPRNRVQLAVYAHRVIDRAIRAGWAEYLMDNPRKQQKPGARQAFRLAFLTGVESQVHKIAPTEAEGRQINAYLQVKYGTSLSQFTNKKPQAIDYDAYCAGADAAQDFQLHRPVEEQQGQLEHQGEDDARKE